MPEYKLKFTDEAEDQDESRQRTLDELYAFIATMDGRTLAVVTLDAEQSALWDQEDGPDYQDAFGREIISQIDDGDTETLVIRDHQGLPVALAARQDDVGWQGVGIDKRLRFEIAPALQNDETEFE